MVGMDSKSWLMLYMSRFVGLPYIWGGQNYLVGYDCSGLAIEYLIAAGKWPANKDTTAQGLYDHFFLDGANERDPDQSEFGDLAFFGVANKENIKITHVGICVGDGMMLEAGGGGSSCKTREDAVKRNAWVRTRPIVSRRDLVGVLAV